MENRNMVNRIRKLVVDESIEIPQLESLFPKCLNCKGCYRITKWDIEDRQYGYYNWGANRIAIYDDMVLEAKCELCGNIKSIAYRDSCIHPFDMANEIKIIIDKMR